MSIGIKESAVQKKAIQEEMGSSLYLKRRWWVGTGDQISLKLRTIENGLAVYSQRAGIVDDFGVFPATKKSTAQTALYLRNPITSGMLVVPETAVMDMTVRSRRQYPQLNEITFDLV